MSSNTSFTTLNVGSTSGRKFPILKSLSSLVSTHYDYLNHLACGSKKCYTFGWVYLRSLNLIFPSFVKIYLSCTQGCGSGSWKRKPWKRLIFCGSGSTFMKEVGSGSKLGSETVEKEPEAEAIFSKSGASRFSTWLQPLG